MKVYTKKGDGGRTSLMRGPGVLKTDDRIELLGTIDELNSQIGLAKVVSDEKLRSQFLQVQKTLMTIMAGVADCMKKDYKLQDRDIERLEEWIDEIEEGLPERTGFVMYGGCEWSARIDVARAVCRRAERRFRKAATKYTADRKAMIYMNRLADYLFVAARYADHKHETEPEEGFRQEIIRKVLKDMDLK